MICTEISGQNWDAYLQQDFARGFDLKEGLTRIAVLPGEEHHRLVWTHHHLILDGWSLAIFSKVILKALNKGNAHRAGCIYAARVCHAPALRTGELLGEQVYPG